LEMPRSFLVAFRWWARLFEIDNRLASNQEKRETVLEPET